MKKFTFKTVKPTGRYKSFFQPNIIIKLDKKEVGCIFFEKAFKIRLMVFKKDIMEDGNPNCPWMWITLRKKSETLQEAKDFLNSNIVQILGKYDIFLEY